MYVCNIHVHNIHVHVILIKQLNYCFIICLQHSILVSDTEYTNYILKGVVIKLSPSHSYVIDYRLHRLIFTFFALLYRDYWQPGQTLPNISPDSPDQLATSSHQQQTADKSILIFFKAFRLAQKSSLLKSVANLEIFIKEWQP